ncbi:MAG: hypothetical protein ACXWCW_28210, partial [Burkholderiales bacterium]
MSRSVLKNRPLPKREGTVSPFRPGEGAGMIGKTPSSGLENAAKWSSTLSHPRVWLPIALFAALVALLGVGLTLNPREVPSPLVGKPAPAFELPLLLDPGKTFSPQQMAGKV